jgi:hypothetical protein
MIQLVIAWTCVGIFIATAVITLLALVRVIRLAEKKYLDRLFKALVLEVVAICLGIFTGKIELPERVEKRYVEKGEEVGRVKTVEALQPELQRLTGLIAQKEAIINRNMARLELSAEEREALKKPVKLNDEVFSRTRVAVPPR